MPIQDPEGKRLGLVLFTREPEAAGEDEQAIVTVSGRVTRVENGYRLDLENGDWLPLPASLPQDAHPADEFREVLDEGEELVLVLQVDPFPEDGDPMDHVREQLRRLDDE